MRRWHLNFQRTWECRAAAIKRTNFFDLGLAIFLCTAAVGVWAAYDRQAAWLKFAGIAGAILLYYLLAIQRRTHLWGVVLLASLFGVMLAAYFLLAYDWQSQPAKIGLIYRFATAWMAIRPDLPLPAPNPDATASILAILIPFPFVLGLKKWGQQGMKAASSLILAVLGVGVMLAAIFLTAERGPWPALGAVFGTWLWWLASARTALWLSWSRRKLFVLGLSIMVGLGVMLVFSYPAHLLLLADQLPGPAQASTRTLLWLNTLTLIQDFPFTGGGLASFAGLYSQYILVIPFKFMENSHNLYLEVAIEQGLLGLLALVVILAGSCILLFRPARASAEVVEDITLLQGAILAGLVIAGLHGLVENALYDGWDILFLFCLPGLSRAATAAADPDEVPGPVFERMVWFAPNGLKFRPDKDVWKRRNVAWPLVAILVGLLGLGMFFQTLLASWYANLGAVQMARIELADFPSGMWDEGRQVTALAPAETLFKRAVALNPGQRTARHRLGLIAILRRDMPAAVYHLEKAYQAEGAGLVLDRSGHPGIRKVLSYSYVWTDSLERAMPLLASLPEAQSEMSVYIDWWQWQHRPDLSQRAAQAVELLQSSRMSDGH